ncbi:hypothetical protein [Mucilaginibacter antarcticus]|uniref:Uncharacterized protein n=1 Tax=Mucilaginibacter antarcticus TaxID=1855725 RepID=A0ABW5XS69_9SPHI
MEHGGPFSERISSFLEAWAALPPPREVSSELVIISAGAVSAKWSFKHVFTAGETYNFIFRKAELTDLNAPWECADRELEALVKGFITQT